MDQRDRSRSPREEGKSTGIAMRWNEKGFGFIKPDDGGEDLFCHSSNIEDGNALEQGSAVRFVKVYDDRKGKERAEQVTGGVNQDRGGSGRGGGAPVQAEFSAEGKGTGIVLRWNEKGFGFITVHGEDKAVFVHQTDIHADGFRSLDEGEPVEFDIIQDPNGKMKATSVTGPDGAFVRGAPKPPPRDY